MLRLKTILPVLLLTIFGWGSLDAVQAQSASIKWVTWEQAVELQKKEKRKIFIDVYTDWCGWCKRMDKTTFSDPVVINYINKNFYAVKFNAERKEDIMFKGKKYKFVANGKRGYHELAAWMLRGRMGYPTVVFLDENANIIQPIPGFLPPEKFEPIMTYFGENQHKKVPWEIYQKRYNSTKSPARSGVPVKD